jgi:hypothetical protein
MGSRFRGGDRVREHFRSRVPDAVQRAAKRNDAPQSRDPLIVRLRLVGPGSASRHFAPRRARDTKAEISSPS